MNRKDTIRGEAKWSKVWVMRFLGLGILVAVFFQNCSDPLNVGADRKSFGQNLPFAYDLVVDQLGYMSCSGFESGGVSTEAYFSLRAGSYFRDSGVKLSEDFFDSTKNYSQQKKMDVLGVSELNAGAEIQMALRELGNYQNVWTSNTAGASGGARIGGDYVNLLGKLDSPIISQSLVGLKANERLQFFDFIEGINSDRLLEGSLSSQLDEPSAGSLRTRLNNDEIMLTFTYTDDLSGSPVWARGPYKVIDGDKPNATSAVFGKGYRLSFGTPFGIRPTIGNSNAPSISHGGNNRRLREVREVDLLNARSTAVGQWECPSDHSFVIVRERDNDTVGCNTGSETQFYNDPIYQKVRQLLRFEEWWVDMGRRCIVPKNTGGGCYVEDSQEEIKVAYDGKVCSLLPKVVPGSAEQELMALCPHQFNLCFLR